MVGLDVCAKGLLAHGGMSTASTMRNLAHRLSLTKENRSVPITTSHGAQEEHSVWHGNRTQLTYLASCTAATHQVTAATMPCSLQAPGQPVVTYVNRLGVMGNGFDATIMGITLLMPAAQSMLGPTPMAHGSLVVTCNHHGKGFVLDLSAIA